MAKRTCKATTKLGKPCRALGVLDNGLCIGHQPRERKEALGFGGSQPNSGRPVKLRTIDVLRQRVEEEMEAIVAPFIEGLTAEHVIGWSGTKDEREPIMVPDLKMRQDSARELLDRAYGKPKQATEISGPEGGPMEVVEMPTDTAWNKSVAKLLNQTGAFTGVSTNGNGNGPDPH